MLHKKTFLFLILIIGNSVIAQNSDLNTEVFNVDVFISANKTVYVETEKTRIKNIQKKVSDIIRDKPFKLDQKIVYKIVADKSLDLGYIMDVNQKMLSAYKNNVITERYLLNTLELNIDGQDRFDSIEIEKLEKSQ